MVDDRVNQHISPATQDEILSPPVGKILVHDGIDSIWRDLRKVPAVYSCIGPQHQRDSLQVKLRSGKIFHLQFGMAPFLYLIEVLSRVRNVLPTPSRRG